MRQPSKDQRDTFLSSFPAYITALSFRTCTLDSLRAQMLLPEASCPQPSEFALPRGLHDQPWLWS